MRYGRVVREKDVEKAVVSWAKKQGMLPFKLNLQGNTGWPDRLWLFYHPYMCFIEFKRPGETLKRNQPARVKELRRRGYSVGVFDNVGDAIKFLGTQTGASGGCQTDGISGGSGATS